MEIKTSFSERVRGFFGKGGKKAGIISLALILGGVGFGVYKIVKAVTTQGATVTISQTSNAIYYGDAADNYGDTGNAKIWETHWYSVTSGGSTYDAMCAEASKSNPAGSAPASSMTNDLVKKIMLVTVPSYSSFASMNYYNLFKAQYDWASAAANITNLRYKTQTYKGYASSYYYCKYYYNYAYAGTNCGGKGLSDSVVSAQNYIFAMGHMMVSYKLLNDTKGLSSADVSQLDSTLASIQSFFNSYPNAVNEFNLFTAVPSDAQLQTVAWLEYTPSYGYVQVCKKDGDGNIITAPGTQFTIRTINSVATYDTTDGCVTVGPLLSGTSVTYSEATAPDGYKRDTGTYYTSVPTSGTNTVYIVNERDISGGVKIKKVDAEMDGAVGRLNTSGVLWASVVGTTFGVYKSTDTSFSSPVVTLVIGNNGEANSGLVLPMGSYVIREISPTTGYKTNTGTLVFTIQEADDGKTFDFTTNSSDWFKNTIIKGGASVAKTAETMNMDGSAGSDVNLSGVTFTLTHKDDATFSPVTLTTGSDGTATTANDALIYGTYTVVENESDANRVYNKYSGEISITTDGVVVPINGGSTIRNTFVDNPSLATFARNSKSAYDNRNQTIGISANESVTDLIVYSGLTTGAQYKMEGILYDKSTMGQVASGSKVFTANTSCATNQDSASCPEVTFEFDSSKYIGKTLEIRQWIYRCSLSAGCSANSAGGWVLEGVHNYALNDPEERVTVKTVDIGTKAANVSGGKTLAVGKVQVVDTISMTGLSNGQTYKLVGKLRDASGNIITLSDGATEVTKSYTMTATSGTTVQTMMTFELETSKFVGQNVTVLEYLYIVDENGNVIDIDGNATTEPIAEHEYVGDPTDENSQTVAVVTPEIGTTATDAVDGDHKLGAGDVSIDDVVVYTGLNPGDTYTLKATVMHSYNKDTGAIEELEIDGEVVTRTKTFVADANGTVTVDSIIFDTRTIQGETLVVYEELYREDEKIAEHKNPEDDNQIVTVETAKIGTVAKDGADGDNVVFPKANQKIVDTVKYEGLNPNTNYTLYGILIDKETEKPLEIDGETVTVTKSFKTGVKGGSGEEEMTFTLDASELPGVEIVVFEYLFEGTSAGDVEDAFKEHTDIDDANQYIKVRARVGTIAADDYDGDQKIGVGMATITDTVAYEGLTVGKTYVMKGELIDKASGKSLGVISEVEFEVGKEGTEKKDGKVTMKFEVNTKDLAGKEIVVFEELYEVDKDEDEEVKIAEHKDLDDESQTITVLEPKIQTTAIDKLDDDKELAENSVAVIVDEVTYEGLVAGTTYRVKGMLMNKKTGEVVVFEKESETEAETTFEARGETGMVTVEFEVNTTGMSGTEIVVFEELFVVEDTGETEEDEDGEEVPVEIETSIAKHEDIEDHQQTVWVKIKAPETGLFTSMLEGVRKNGVAVAFVVIVIASGAALVVVRINRKQKISF